VALSSITTEALDPAVLDGCLDIDAASELSSLLVNLRYDLLAEQVKRFRRSALLDIDPGLLQMWIAVGRYSLAQHDLYFTIGETVGTPAALFPSFGLEWHYTPPPVYLPTWPRISAPPTAAYTTVAHWWGEEIDFDGTPINTEKRESFLHYAELPSRVARPLELALTMGDAEEEERKFWGGYGWRVQDSHQVTATPEEYRAYIQQSRGEFSCAPAANPRSFSIPGRAVSCRIQKVSSASAALMKRRKCFRSSNRTTLGNATRRALWLKPISMRKKWSDAFWRRLYDPHPTRT
jgi:hypothetical protein